MILVTVTVGAGEWTILVPMADAVYVTVTGLGMSPPLVF